MARTLCACTTSPKWFRSPVSRIACRIRAEDSLATPPTPDNFYIIPAHTVRPDLRLIKKGLSMRHFYRLSLLRAVAPLFFALGAFAQLPPANTGVLRPPQGTPGTAACSATESSACAQAAAKIIPIVMGDSPLQENLRKLTDEVGGRVAGSPEMAKAVEWGVAAFRAAGVDVHTEKYTLPVTWHEGDTRLNPTEPISALVKEAVRDGKIFTIMPGLRAVSEAWGPPTPKNGITAKIVDVGDGSEGEFARAGATVKDAILLVHTDLGSTWADLFNKYLRPPEIISRAVRDGASAILWMGARERLLLYRHTNSLNGEIDRIPQAIVAREDAMWLARLASAYPGEVQVSLKMPNKIGGPIEQKNVVGEIRGYEKPDEVVILGAHLDSWELGTGALGNRCT